MENRLEVVAFFLPQFHPIPENDRWWGPGFTEWTHAAAARPLFEGHLQPRLPADLGFYDLRVPETRRAQWELAARHGVTALCYWHYWFGDGIQLLARPVMDLLEYPDLPHRYCLGWANQTWTGVWHGRGDEILQAQRYPGEADHIKHFNYLLPHFLDERYLTVNGRPVFYFLRPGDIPGLGQLVALWQQLAVEAGLPGLYLVGDVHATWMHEAGQPLDAAVWDPAPPPRGHEWESSFPAVPLREDPRAFRYDKTFADWLLSGLTTGIRQHPCVVPGFDNTPRSGRRGILLHGLDPGVFEDAVREAARREQAMPGPRMMFIKSWNEWGEGAIMEPDKVFGRAFLRALQRGLAALPQSFSAPGVRLLIVWLSGFRPAVCLLPWAVAWRCPGCPGAHRLRPRRAVPPSVLLGLFMLVRMVLAGPEPLPAGEECVLPRPVGADREAAKVVVTCNLPEPGRSSPFNRQGRRSAGVLCQRT